MDGRVWGLASDGANDLNACVTGHRLLALSNPLCLYMSFRSDYAESLNSLLDSIRFQLTGETPTQGGFHFH